MTKKSFSKFVTLILFSAGVTTCGSALAQSNPQDSNKIDVNISADFNQTKKIFKNQVGIFYEDLAQAADGGLYAELVENRDFEYSTKDNESWNSMTGWRVISAEGAGVSEIRTENPIHANNPHHIVLHVKQANSVYLQNNGFGGFPEKAVSPFELPPSPEGGIPVKRGAKYIFSTFMKYNGAASKHYLHVMLISPEGNTLAESNIYREKTDTWEQIELELVSNGDCDNSTLVLVPQTSGDFSFDMVSLFPRDTFRGRKNGLRKDLAEAIENLHPSFIRFPGGCVIHGNSIANAYRWEESVGPLEARVPLNNMRNYHQTRGLGYYEYFQFCEDIGAEPLPVVPVGVSCQFTEQNKCELLPMEKMPEYIQSILDLIEWANGPINTKWGAVRAEAGHPAPFNMKYIALGNEERYSDEYAERMTMICKAIQEKYPQIRIVGNAGPGAADDFHDVTDGRDFKKGWELCRTLNMYGVDEHYYKPSSWFYNNQDYYDNYDRKGPKVFLGEYSSFSNLDGGMEAALTTALHQIMMERNGDIVFCATFSLALVRTTNLSATQRTLINFNRSTHIKSNVYWIQKIFSEFSGDEYAKTTIKPQTDDEFEQKRLAGTIIRDKDSGDIILKFVNVNAKPVALNIDLGGISVNPTAQVTVYSAESLNDAAPIMNKSEIQASTKMTADISPFSMTAIRFKTK